MLIGRLNENIAPLPLALFSAQILPPWDSTMFFDMNKPNPVPPVSDTTANFENSFGNTSGSIPAPVSFIVVIPFFFYLYNQ